MSAVEQVTQLTTAQAIVLVAGSWLVLHLLAMLVDVVREAIGHPVGPILDDVTAEVRQLRELLDERTREQGDYLDELVGIGSAVRHMRDVLDAVDEDTEVGRAVQRVARFEAQLWHAKREQEDSGER